MHWGSDIILERSKKLEAKTISCSADSEQDAQMTKETNSVLNFPGFISLNDLFVVFPTEEFLENHFCTVW